MTPFPPANCEKIVQAIARLAETCARECGGESLVEVWLSETAYDMVCMDAIRSYEKDENTPKKYTHGLVSVYFPTGKVGIRRAS